MLIAFLITLREGLEAALIVGIIASFLSQSGYSHLMNKVWSGVILAAIICFAMGLSIHYITGEIPQKQQELFVGIIGLIAVVMITYMIFFMQNFSVNIKTEIAKNIAHSNAKNNALIIMSFLAVLREGMESVFFLIAVFEQSQNMQMPFGAVLGLLTAIFIGYLIYKGGVSVNLKRFFNITSLFLIFVAAGLFSGSFRAFHEAGLWNFGQTIIADFSPLLHQDSILGVFMSGFFGYTDHPNISDITCYLIYLLPVLYSYFLSKNNGKKAMKMINKNLIVNS